jgi:hypothetical protein
LATFANGSAGTRAPVFVTVAGAAGWSTLCGGLELELELVSVPLPFSHAATAATATITPIIRRWNIVVPILSFSSRSRPLAAPGAA